MPSINRRDFLKASATAAALSTPLFAGMRRPNTDYKALVCILLEGGADTLGMVLPRFDARADAHYRALRPGMIPSPKTIRPLVASRYGLHPEMPQLQRLYNRRDVAIVANVGALEAPVDKQTILSQSAPLPPQLFQKIAQRDHQMMAGDDARGWAARVADQLKMQRVNVSFGGLNRMQYGAHHPALIGHDPHFGVLDDPDNLIGRLERIDLGIKSDASEHEMPLGRQLESVLSLMAARRSAQLPGRQIYFVRQSGWDTHGMQSDEIVRHFRRKTAELDTAIGAFVDGLTAWGLDERVTTFTTQDLAAGMRLSPVGADHGWGGHALVVGGAVRGGLYGTMPRMRPGSPDALDDNALIPTTATDQYLATLVAWLGDGALDTDALFPRLHRFKQSTLGFMA